MAEIAQYVEKVIVIDRGNDLLAVIIKKQVDFQSRVEFDQSTIAEVLSSDRSVE